MSDGHKQELVGKLKAAFNSAVFLGYRETREALTAALDQIAPLTEMEKRATYNALTEAELRIRNSGPELEARVAETKKSLRATLAGARKMATEVTHQSKLAKAILKAQRALPPKTPVDQYYRELPMMTGSAGLVIIKNGKLLLQETAYKDGLEIPGGTMDANESPLRAAIRECQEELGVTPEIIRNICEHHKSANGEKLHSVHHLFLGSLGKQKISIDYEEVGRLHWVPIEKAVAKIAKERPDLAVRVGAALAVLETGGSAYCEDDKQIFPAPTAQKIAVPKAKQRRPG